MHIARRSSLALFFLFLLFASLLAEAVSAADITVDEDCTLSKAIIAANNDAAFEKCPAGDGADKLTLTDDVTLSGRLHTITADLTIDGDGHTVSGNDSAMVFLIADAAVTLEDITITNGRTGARGGAIHVELGDLNLVDAIVRDNWAGDAGGGIYVSDGNVTISGSQVNNNKSGRSGGAGLYFTSSTNAHTLNIEEWSGFSGNVASQDGGAIRVAGGIVEIDKSSFSNNIADEGGVIEIWNGTLQVENSTMSANHAREGGAINAGADSDSTTPVTIIHVTMARNTADERGASIALTGSQATLSIGNTIISGDTAEGVTHCHPGVSEYSVISWKSNRISDGSCPLPPPAEEEEETTSQAAPDLPMSRLVAEEFTVFHALDEEETTEQHEASPASQDVQLGEPRTWRGVIYYPLQRGSNAIDAADQEMCEGLRDPDSDLADTSRPQGEGCDIGAFELPWAEETPEPPDQPDPPDPPEPLVAPESTESPPEPPVAPESPEPPEEPEATACVSITVAGDSLYSVAQQFGTTIEEIRALNRLHDDVLSIGQELILPGCESPRPEDPYICEDIPIDIFIKSPTADLRCDVVNISEIDKHPLMNAGIEVAVDIWGRADLGVEVCFSGGGSLVFVDTRDSSAAVTQLRLYSEGDLTCGRLDRSGTVVLVAPLSEAESIPLTECQLTTADVLRLRDEADGVAVKALVPFGVTLPAKARTASWFFVDFMDMDGWISAEHVQAEGNCV